MIARILIQLFLLGLPNFLIAQEIVHELEPDEKKHKLSFVLSHAHIGEGIKNGKKDWLVLPSFGLDYNYQVSPLWSIGLHNDLIIESFKILKSDGETELERTRPFVSILTAGFKPGKHLTYQLGFGGEFAKEENFFLTRLGLEYGWEISERMEIFTNLVYDLKWNNYNSYVIGLGFTRKL